MFETRRTSRLLPTCANDESMSDKSDIARATLLTMRRLSENMHRVRRKQRDADEGNAGNAEPAGKPDERHHAGDDSG